MKIIQKVLTPNEYSRPQILRKATNGIVIHYVGNPGSTSLANRNYFENQKITKQSYVSSNYIIGLEGEILLCVPENEIAYCSNNRNSDTISIENCHPSSDGKFNQKTYKSLIWLCVDICKRYGLNPLTQIIRHYDVNGKQCPLYYVHNVSAWEQLKKDIYSELNAIKGKKIMSEATATIGQMKTWAKKQNAEAWFVMLADEFWKIANAAGVNPVVAYCQSAKETAYGHFGGVLDKSYCNPCGMKNTSGGSDTDKSAHMRFDLWADGISAQIDHLALYAGAYGYPKTTTKDPRHFSSITGTAKIVEALGGKWAPSLDYGTDIVKMIDKLEHTTEYPELCFEDALAMLVKNGIINTPEYWRNTSKLILYLDVLIINMAKAL